jgi:hypothetical protein
MHIKAIKQYLACAAILALAACGGTSESDNVVYVDGVKVKSTLNRTGTYDVQVSGTHNEVTISSGNKVGSLDIAGINNKVRIQAGTEVGKIDMAGSGNTVYVPVGFKTKITRDGSNNEVEEYSGTP